MVSQKQLRNIIAGPDSGIVAFTATESRAKDGFVPSEEDVARWFDSVRREMARIESSMTNPATLSMAVVRTETERGCDLSVDSKGFDYVVRRSKHPDTPESERRELRKVITYCNLIESVEAATRYATKGDWVRFNKVMNTKGVRA